MSPSLVAIPIATGLGLFLLRKAGRTPRLSMAVDTEGGLGEDAISHRDHTLSPLGSVCGVRDHDDRLVLLAIDLFQKVEQGLSVMAVQAAGRFVGEENLRPVC